VKTLTLTDEQAHVLRVLMDRDGNYDFIGKEDEDPEVFWELYDAVREQLA
jgi:hypothetical protein